MITLEESVLFDEFTPGRRSFRGFNPAIESLTTERKVEELVANARKTAEAQSSGTKSEYDAEADTPIEAFSNIRKQQPHSRAKPPVPASTSSGTAAGAQKTVKKEAAAATTVPEAVAAKKAKARTQQMEKLLLPEKEHARPVEAAKKKKKRPQGAQKTRR